MAVAQGQCELRCSSGLVGDTGAAKPWVEARYAEAWKMLKDVDVPHTKSV